MINGRCEALYMNFINVRSCLRCSCFFNCSLKWNKQGFLAHKMKVLWQCAVLQVKGPESRAPVVLKSK